MSSIAFQKKDVMEEIKKKVNKFQNSEIIYPVILDIHPVMNQCNLNCGWCIGGESSDNTGIFLSFDQCRELLFSIFNINRQYNWPLEIHICGNNSEPLLNIEFIIEFLKFINNRAIVKLITNGILLNRLFPYINLVHEISISLDVWSENQFIQLKGGSAAQYQKIFSNIEHIKSQRELLGNPFPALYVSFVINEEFDKNEFLSFCIKLKRIGINHIQVRCNYYNNSINQISIKTKIEEISKVLNGTNNTYLIYNNQNFDMKFNEYSDRIQEKGFECNAWHFWPVIAADYQLYPCAHVANRKYSNISIDLNKHMNYYSLFTSIPPFFCECCNICPSMLNYINHLLLQ